MFVLFSYGASGVRGRPLSLELTRSGFESRPSIGIVWKLIRRSIYRAYLCLSVVQHSWVINASVFLSPSILYRILHRISYLSLSLSIYLSLYSTLFLCLLCLVLESVSSSEPCLTEHQIISLTVSPLCNCHCLDKLYPKLQYDHLCVYVCILTGIPWFPLTTEGTPLS